MQTGKYQKPLKKTKQLELNVSKLVQKKAEITCLISDLICARTQQQSMNKCKEEGVKGIRIREGNVCKFWFAADRRE